MVRATANTSATNRVGRRSKDFIGVALGVAVRFILGQVPMQCGVGYDASESKAESVPAHCISQTAVHLAARVRHLCTGGRHLELRKHCATMSEHAAGMHGPAQMPRFHNCGGSKQPSKLRLFAFIRSCFSYCFQSASWWARLVHYAWESLSRIKHCEDCIEFVLAASVAPLCGFVGNAAFPKKRRSCLCHPCPLPGVSQFVDPLCGCHR